MGNPGAPRPLERRYSNHPMLPREEPDELEVVEVRKEEPMKAGKSGYPEGTCEKCGEHKRIMGRGLCGKCYMAMRTEQKKAGTWNPILQGHDRFKERYTEKAKAEETEKPAPKATPQANEQPINILPHKGKLYLLAEIRVMTEEQLREMFGG